MKTGLNNKIRTAGLSLAIATLAALPLGSAHAAGSDLAEKYGCMGCHKVEKKGMGPAFKDIAAKYKGDAAAPGKLLTSVKSGSTGTWGPKKMAAQGDAPEADVKVIIAWVMGL